MSHIESSLADSEAEGSSTRGYRQLYTRSRRSPTVSTIFSALDRTFGVDMSTSVLRPGGVFIYLTFGQPHFRRRYLTRPDTTLEICQLGEAFHYYLYVMRK
jgi:hypothetical protein